MSKRKKSSKSPDKAPNDFGNFSEIFATYLSNKFFCGFHDKAQDYVAAEKHSSFKKAYRYIAKTYAEGFTHESKLYKILLSDLSKSFCEHLCLKIDAASISNLICQGVLCEYFSESNEPDIIACEFIKQVVGSTATFCMTEFISEKKMQRSPELNTILKNKILKIIAFKSQEIFKKFVSKMHGKSDTDIDSTFVAHLSNQIKNLQLQLVETQAEKEKFYNYTQQLYTALIESSENLEKLKRRKKELKAELEKKHQKQKSTPKHKKEAPVILTQPEVSRKDQIKLLDIASTIEKLDEDYISPVDIKLSPPSAVAEQIEVLDILKTSFDEDDDDSLDSENQFSFDSD